MSDDKQAKRCVKFFKIGRKLGTLDGMRKRFFLQKLHRKTIKNYLTSSFNTTMINEIYAIETEMKLQADVDLDRVEEKLIDLYETLLSDTLDLTDQLLEEETK